MLINTYKLKTNFGYGNTNTINLKPHLKNFYKINNHK